MKYWSFCFTIVARLLGIEYVSWIFDSFSACVWRWPQCCQQHLKSTTTKTRYPTSIQKGPKREVENDTFEERRTLVTFTELFGST